MDLTTKWLIALYGWIGFNFIVWYWLWNKSEKKKEKFKWGEYFYTHVDNWAFTALFTVPIVFNGPEIHAFIMLFYKAVAPEPMYVDIPWYDFFYAGPGPLAELVYWIATTIVPAIKDKALGAVLAWVPNKNTPPPSPPTGGDQNVT